MAPRHCAEPSSKRSQRDTPRASSVAFLLRRQPRSTPLSLDLSHHPQAQSLDIRPHDLETYDELTRTKTPTMTTNNSLASQLKQIGFAPCPHIWMTSSRASPRPAAPLIRFSEELAQVEASERSRRSLERASSSQRH